MAALYPAGAVSPGGWQRPAAKNPHDKNGKIAARETIEREPSCPSEIEWF
jgi:hypothetical protein